MKPEFIVDENSIQVLLPVLSAKEAISETEQKVISVLSENRLLSSSEIAATTGFSKDKVIRTMSSLAKKGFVQITGNGRSTKYALKK